MKKEIKVIIGLLIVLLIVLLFGIFFLIKSTCKLKKSEVEEIVLKDLNKKDSEVWFTKIEMDFEDGKYIYEIELTSNQIVYEYEVDAKKGAILKKEIKKFGSMPEENISFDEIKSIAFEDAKVKKENSNISILKEELDSAKQIYKIEFIYEENKYEYEIQSKTKEIVKKEVKSISSNFVKTEITIEQAKAIVLKDAKLETISNVAFTKEKQEFDNGKIVYELEFLYNRNKYEYEVDASNGIILEKEIETIK